MCYCLDQLVRHLVEVAAGSVSGLRALQQLLGLGVFFLTMSDFVGLDVVPDYRVDLGLFGSGVGDQEGRQGWRGQPLLGMILQDSSNRSTSRWSTMIRSTTSAMGISSL